MAARSIAKSKSVGKPLSAIQELLKNPEVSFAFAVLFADAVLVALIIAYVPYTKIDWDAYMSQVTGFLEGERDYSNLKGDTGPLVYPAGFLYIYSGIQYVTGGQVYPAQIFFGLLYIVNLGIILSIYVKTKAVPWWALSLLSLSKRVHSIFVLRLFNDCFAMTLLHAALLLLLYQKWHLGLIIFSGAVSVKMNVLLYAPPLFVLMLKAMDVFGIISALAGAALVQILLGLPFLLSYPVAYLSRAFNLGRIFIHFWSVNFKFVPEPIFVSKEFAIALLAAHLGLLTLFAHYRWSSMSEITENATAQSEEVIRSQQPGDLQHVPAAYKLNGKNYLKWSQLIRTILKGKGKISHLMGTAPNSSNPNFEVWEEEDAMIMAWLWGSMTPEISDTCMFLNTAKEIWDAVQLTYSKAKDAAQVYEVKVKTTAVRQGNKTVTEYANQLSTLWQELDQYGVIKTKCSDDAAVLKNFIEQDRVYDFLVGLNPEFDQVRVEILGKSDVPCFNEVVDIVRGEESRRNLMLEPQVSINSAMVAGNGHKLNITPEKKLASDERQSGGSRNQDRDKLWCTYCKKP